MLSRIESIAALVERRKVWRSGSVALATKAARACLAQSHYRPAEVQLLVSTGVYRDGHMYEPAMAALIQKRLRLNTTLEQGRTFSFDLHHGGCGMLTAVHAVDAMLRNGAARVGLVLGSEANPDADATPYSGALRTGAALLIDRSPTAGQGFLAFAFRTFDAHAELYLADLDLRVSRGRAVVQVAPAAELTRSFIQCSAETMETLWATSGQPRESLAWVIAPQLSAEFLDGLGCALGVPRATIYDAGGAVVGDTLSTSTFVALEHGLRSGAVRPGQTVVLLSIAAGIHVGCALYRV